MVLHAKEFVKPIIYGRLYIKSPGLFSAVCVFLSLAGGEAEALSERDETAKRQSKSPPLGDEELAEQNAEALPDRGVMSVIARFEGEVGLGTPDRPPDRT